MNRLTFNDHTKILIEWQRTVGGKRSREQHPVKMDKKCNMLQLKQGFKWR